MIKMGVC